MPNAGLPVNVDTTNPDSGSDATVQVHQAHHDAVHAHVNKFDTAAGSELDGWVKDSTGLFVPKRIAQGVGGGRERYYDNGTKNANFTMDLAQGNIQSFTLGTDGIICSFTGFSAVANTSHYWTVYVQQDATGGRTTLPFSGVTWASNVVPALDGNASTIDAFAFETHDGGATITGWQIMSGTATVQSALDYQNGIESPASGTQVSAANSAYAGNNGFSTVNLPAGATVAADSTQAYRGSQSLKIATGATSGGTYVSWDFGTGQLVLWVRFWLYITAFPAALTSLLNLLDSSAAVAGSLRLSTTGTINTYNAAGGGVNTGTAVVNTNGWTRVEAKYVMSTTVGQVETKVFTTPGSLTADETLTSAANKVMGANARYVRFGNPNGVVNFGPIWMDGLAVSFSNYAALS